MKRLLSALFILFLTATLSFAQTRGKVWIIQSTDCSAFITEGIVCWDTDNDILYVGNGTTAVPTGSIGGTPSDGDCALYESSTGTWIAGACPGAGTGAPTDAEYVTYSINGTLSAERVLTDPGDSSGIDISTAIAGQIQLTIDPTELVNKTWGAGEASSTHTFNVSGTTDPVWTYSDGVANLSAGTIQQGGVAVQVQGNDIAAAAGNNAFTIDADDDDTDTLVLRAYDVGSGWDNLITLTSSATPTLALAADGGVTIQGVTLAGGANTFSLTNGTASLDIAAAATLNIDKSLTVQTGAITITGDSGGSALTLPTALSFAGTLTDEYLCNYEATGTYINCDIPTSTFQSADATLTALAGFTGADVTVIEFTAADTVNPVTSGGANYMLASDGTNANLAFIAPATVLSNIGAQATDATLTALAGLTIQDVSVIQGTGADAFGVLASGGNNYILGSTTDNTALEFKQPTGTGAPMLGTSPSVTTSILAVSNATIGTDAAEFGNVYLGDGAIIYGQANQSATLTSSASLWTANNFGVTTQFKLPSSDADPTGTAGYLRHDSTISNFTNGGLVYYNGAAIKQLVDMTTATASACTDDQVVAYDADNDLWYCKADETAAADATLVALAALTIADVTVIEGTGADAFNMVASGGNNYILGSNSDNTALEFKTPANVLSQIGAQASDAELESIAALTEAEGKIIIANATPEWDESAFTLPIAVCTEGQIWKMSASAGVFVCAADEGGSTALDDVGDPDAATSISLGDNEGITLESAEDTGIVLLIKNTDADLAGATSLLDLSYNDDGQANGYFIRGYDHEYADLKFSIGADGAASFGIVTATGFTIGAAAITEAELELLDGETDLATQTELNTVAALVDTDDEIIAIINASPSTAISPAAGGTGIVNNAASTITISGNFGTTFTVTGATALTLPTSGTVTALGATIGASEVDADVATQEELNTVAALVDTDDEIIAIINASPSTQISVAAGGTGAASLTDGGILLGSGTGAITALGAATNGQIPIGDGTTDPVLNEIDGTANEVDITNGAGTITVGLVAAPVITTSLEAPFIIIGSAATAADAGGIRLPNASYIMAEADVAGTDISVIGVDSSEVVQIAASGASGVTITPATTFTGDITVSGGNINTGAVALVVGDAATQTITFTTDGTGNAELTFPLDSIGNADIDWGTGAGQVSQDDVVDGSTYERIAGVDVENSHVMRMYDDDETGSITITGLTDARAITFQDATQTVANLGGTQTFSGAKTFSSPLILNYGATDAGTITIYEDSSNGSNYMTFKGPATLAGDTIVFVLPSTNGNNGEVLITDGSGNTSWSATGAADVLAVGDCASGACFDGTSDGGTYISFYDAQGATQLIGGDTAGAVTLTLPVTTSTLAGLAVAETFTAHQTIADNINLVFGTGSDWAITYDETTDDSLELTTAKVGAAETTDPMFMIQVDSGGSGMTADQYVLGVYKSTTRLLSVDEDGDVYYAGTLTGAASDDPYLLLDETSGTDWWLGVDDTGNSIELRTNTTVGNSVQLELDEDGDLHVTGDVYITGDDLFMTTNTSGAVLVANGTNFNPVVMSGNGSIGTDGTLTVTNFNISGTEAIGSLAVYSGSAWQVLTTGATSGHVLTSQGTGSLPVYAAVTASAGGSDTHIQYNSSGSLAGEAAFYYTAANNTVNITQSSTNPTIQTGDNVYSWGHTPMVGIEGVLEVDGAAYFDGDAVIGDDLSLLSDGAILNFGADNDVTLTHVADVGLTLNLDLTVTGADITLISATAGAGITGGNGTLSLKGLGGGTDEIMTIDLNSANLITFASTTDATFAFTPAVGFTAQTTHSAGINLGTSQAIVGTTGLTIGNNGQTIAIDSSDWNIDATGAMTGIGAITSNGAWLTTGTLSAGAAGFTVDADGDVTGLSFTSTGADGTNRIVITNNTAIAPTASANEIYPDANIWKLNQNGTEFIIPIIPTTAAQLTFTTGAATARTITFPDAAITVARTDAGQTFTGVQAFTAPTVATSITPDTAANASLGTGLLPFSSVFIGDAATNNVQLINTAAESAVVLTLPSTTGTLALETLVAVDFGLTADADAGDYDVHSIDGLYGIDDNVYIDLGEDGYITLEADTGIKITAPTDFGDEDITSLDKLEGVDTGVFIDMGADGIVTVQSDTNLDLNVGDDGLRLTDGTNQVIVNTGDGMGVTSISLSALNLVTTGTIQGGIVIDSDADGKDAAAMTAVGVRGSLFIATGAGTWILPTAVAGMSLCVMDSGTSHDLIVDVTTNDYIILAGTTLVQNAGITNAATATTGDYVCFVATAAGYWSTMGMSGAWVTQ